jgi:CRP/FNR family cyclic AMP-dependent transcriptional regulator
VPSQQLLLPNTIGEVIALTGPAGTFWGRLSPAEQAAFAAAATRSRFAAGAVIVGQGEQTKQVYVVLGGHIKVIAGAAAGHGVMLAVCGPGEVLGELSAIDGRPRSATMTAIDAVDVLLLPASRLQGLCDLHPRIAWSLLEVIAQRLRETDQQRAEYGGGSTMQRVVTLLLDLANRLGRLTPEGVHIASPFTQQELAETASTSRESMARMLRELREEGVITTGRGYFVIHRMERLRELVR